MSRRALAFPGEPAHHVCFLSTLPEPHAMVLCPVALAVGCKKCPIFSVCPVKGVIGDYKKPEPEDTRPAASSAKAHAKKKKR
jgi:hypothetical protein